MEILTTKRLSLRTLKEEDFLTLYTKVFSDYEVVKNTFGSSMFSKEETFEFLKTNGNFDKQLGLSALIEKQTNKIIGLAGVLKCEYLEQIDYEIGFILEKESWNKGYAKEIGFAQIEFIKNILKQKRAIALVSNNNQASIKSLEKLNFKYEKTIEVKRGERLIYSLVF